MPACLKIMLKVETPKFRVEKSRAVHQPGLLQMQYRFTKVVSLNSQIYYYNLQQNER